MTNLATPEEICNPASMRPLIGIELDDKSKARDGFVEQVFDAAGLPLFRVRMRRQYSVEDPRNLSVHTLGSPMQSQERILRSAGGRQSQRCDCVLRCGSPMALM